MYVRAESVDDDIRVTVDALVELANVVAGRPAAGLESLDRLEQVRAVLVEHDFIRARTATDAELASLTDRLVSLARLVEGLPDGPLADSVEAVNAQLEASAIAPKLSSHDDFPLHIHWTGPSTPFAHQVVVDLLMSLAQHMIENGMSRFGRCAADDCDRVFLDTTKNNSRRFCADPRCASRTHTAAHRARRGG